MMRGSKLTGMPGVRVGRIIAWPNGARGLRAVAKKERCK